MSNLRLFIILLLLFPAFSCVTAQNAKTVAYINEHAITVSTDPDDTTFSDLQPLKSILANRRVVGMGEATHGTHEFFAMKHRMLEFLVKKMGFRAFAIEANFTECRAVNDYVLYGKGDAKKVIAGMYFWTWNTNEVLKMVEWMRNYNRGKREVDKVKFYGFDMQFNKVACPLVASELYRLDSTYYNAHFSSLIKLRNTVNGVYPKYTQPWIDSIRRMLNNIKIYVANKDADLAKIYSREEITNMTRDIRLLEQSFEEGVALNQKFINGSLLRDKYMAENVEWILNHEGPNSKIMLWAHNVHMSKTAVNMGGYLKDSLKDEYYTIGFDFNMGGLRALDAAEHKVKNFSVAQSMKNSTGEFFSQFNKPAFFIDMEAAQKTDASTFFNKKMMSRSIGAIYDANHDGLYYLKQSLYGRFDGLIFINQVTAAIPIQ
jgi:erythromycin esterase